MSLWNTIKKTVKKTLQPQLQPYNGGILSPEMFQVSKMTQLNIPYRPTAVDYDQVQDLIVVGNESGTVRIIGGNNVQVTYQSPLFYPIRNLYFVTNKGAVIIIYDYCFELVDFKTIPITQIAVVYFKHKIDFTFHVPFTRFLFYYSLESSSNSVKIIRLFDSTSAVSSNPTSTTSSTTSNLMIPTVSLSKIQNHLTLPFSSSPPLSDVQFFYQFNKLLISQSNKLYIYDLTTHSPTLTFTFALPSSPPSSSGKNEISANNEISNFLEIFKISKTNKNSCFYVLSKNYQLYEFDAKSGVCNYKFPELNCPLFNYQQHTILYIIPIPTVATGGGGRGVYIFGSYGEIWIVDKEDISSTSNGIQLIEQGRKDKKQLVKIQEVKINDKEEGKSNSSKQGVLLLYRDGVLELVLLKYNSQNSKKQKDKKSENENRNRNRSRVEVSKNRVWNIIHEEIQSISKSIIINSVANSYLHLLWLYLRPPPSSSSSSPSTNSTVLGTGGGKLLIDKEQQEQQLQEKRLWITLNTTGTQLHFWDLSSHYTLYHIGHTPLPSFPVLDPPSTPPTTTSAATKEDAIVFKSLKVYSNPEDSLKQGLSFYVWGESDSFIFISFYWNSNSQKISCKNFKISKPEKISKKPSSTLSSSRNQVRFIERIGSERLGLVLKHRQLLILELNLKSIDNNNSLEKWSENVNDVTKIKITSAALGAGAAATGNNSDRSKTKSVIVEKLLLGRNDFEIFVFLSNLQVLILSSKKNEGKEWKITGVIKPPIDSNPLVHSENNAKIYVLNHDLKLMDFKAPITNLKDVDSIESTSVQSNNKPQDSKVTSPSSSSSSASVSSTSSSSNSSSPKVAKLLISSNISGVSAEANLSNSPSMQSSHSAASDAPSNNSQVTSPPPLPSNSNSTPPTSPTSPTSSPTSNSSVVNADGRPVTQKKIRAKHHVNTTSNPSQVTSPPPPTSPNSSSSPTPSSPTLDSSNPTTNPNELETKEYKILKVKQNFTNIQVWTMIVHTSPHLSKIILTKSLTLPPKTLDFKLVKVLLKHPSTVLPLSPSTSEQTIEDGKEHEQEEVVVGIAIGEEGKIGIMSWEKGKEGEWIKDMEEQEGASSGSSLKVDVEMKGGQGQGSGGGGGDEQVYVGDQGDWIVIRDCEIIQFSILNGSLLNNNNNNSNTQKCEENVTMFSLIPYTATVSEEVSPNTGGSSSNNSNSSNTGGGGLFSKLNEMWNGPNTNNSETNSNNIKTSLVEELINIPDSYDQSVAPVSSTTTTVSNTKTEIKDTFVVINNINNNEETNNEKVSPKPVRTTTKKVRGTATATATTTTTTGTGTGTGTATGTGGNTRHIKDKRDEIGEVKDVMNENKRKLEERGRVMEEMVDASAQLESNSADFLKAVQQLNRRTEKESKLFGFF